MASITTGGQSQSGDLVWSATVDDKTGSFFIRWDQNVDAMVNKTRTGMRQTTVGSQESARNIGFLAGAIGGVTAKLVEMGTQAVMQFKQMLMGSVQLAARAETLAIALTRVGENAGYTNEEMSTFEEQLKSAGITTVQARQQLMRLASAGLDLTKAYDLARTAQNLAVVAGTNSSEMFDRLTHAILTLNPAILTDIGLNVQLEAAYKKATGSADATGASLDYQTKKQIALNAVLEAGTAYMGTYEAAMSTAGKQAGSLARYIEETQLEFGQIMQPAYREWISIQTEFWKNLRVWLVDNKDLLRDVGLALLDLLKAVRWLAGALMDLIPLKKVLVDIPNLIKDAGTALAGVIVGQEEARKRAENLGTTWNQVWAMVVGGATQAATAITEVFRITGELTDAFKKDISKPFWLRTLEDEEAWLAALTKADEEWRNIGKTAKEAGDKAMIEWSLAHGLIEQVADSGEKAADRMGEIAAETEDAASAMEKLNEKMGKDFMELQLRWEREDLEELIDLARRREDIARNYAKSVERIHKNAARDRVELLKDLAEEEQDLLEDQAEERAEAEQDHANQLLDIEINYRRELEDIQRNFWADAQEAARANDAVAVARLIRQKNRQIQEAQIARDREIEDENRNYDQEMQELLEHQAERRAEIQRDAEERLREFEENLQQQLAEAKEAMDEEYAELQFQLDREKEDKERHRQWDLEDLNKKYKTELEQLGTHLADMKYLDESALKWLLGQHGKYIQDDLTLWDSYYKALRTMKSSSAYYTPGPNIPVTDYSYDPNDPYENPEDYMGGMASGGMRWFNRPGRIDVAENEPELVAAIPMSAVVSYNHNINMSGDLNVNAPQGYGDDIHASVMGILKQFGEQLLAKQGAYAR